MARIRAGDIQIWFEQLGPGTIGGSAPGLLEAVDGGPPPLRRRQSAVYADSDGGRAADQHRLLAFETGNFTLVDGRDPCPGSGARQRWPASRFGYPLLRRTR